MTVFALTLHRLLDAFAGVPWFPALVLIGIGLILHELHKRKDG